MCGVHLIDIRINVEASYEMTKKDDGGGSDGICHL